jgi:hypothetical protein
MADEADRAQPYIENVVAEGRARAELAAKNERLRPIIQVLDGKRFGICHYCETPIRPGNLFCETDKEAPEHSCSVEWEHEHVRKRDLGL